MVPPATPILRFIARNAKGARASGDNVATHNVGECESYAPGLLLKPANSEH